MSDDEPKVADFAAKKWEKQQNPASHSPEEALNAAARFIKDNEVEHVIVFLGKTTESGANATFLQSGKFNFFEQMGLVKVCSDQIMECSLRDRTL